MAIDNFIPQLWAGSILQNLHKAQVFGSELLVNKDYEGEIRAGGDTVNIQALGAVNVIDYTKNTDLSALQVMSDSTQQLLIDKQKAFNVFLDDIDVVQQKPKVRGEITREAAYALSDTADTLIATAMAAGVSAGNVVGSATEPVTPSATTAYEYLVDLGVLLDEANVPSAGRWAAIPPWFEGLLLKDDRFVAGGGSNGEARLMNGVIGQAAGMTVVKSNNVPATAADPVTLSTSAAADDIIDATAHGFVEDQEIEFTALTGGAGLTVGTRYFVIAANLAANTFQVSATRGGAAVNFTTDITAGTATSLATSQVLAGSRMATSFADQIVKTESLRSTTRIGDILRGLHVYGIKVVRPTALASVHITRA